MKDDFDYSKKSISKNAKSCPNCKCIFRYRTRKKSKETIAMEKIAKILEKIYHALL